MTPTPKPGILDIAPYVGGRAAVPGVKDPIKLSSNETPLGPSAKAVEALAKASRTIFTSIPKAAPGSCAKRSPRFMAWILPASSRRAKAPTRS